MPSRSTLSLDSQNVSSSFLPQIVMEERYLAGADNIKGNGEFTRTDKSFQKVAGTHTHTGPGTERQR